MILNGYILSLAGIGEEIPNPSEGDGIFFELNNTIPFALELKNARKEEGLTQIEVAIRLNVSQPTYQKLENPTKANPSLNTITKIEKELFHHNTFRPPSDHYIGGNCTQN